MSGDNIDLALTRAAVVEQLPLEHKKHHNLIKYKLRGNQARLLIRENPECHSWTFEQWAEHFKVSQNGKLGKLVRWAFEQEGVERPNHIRKAPPKHSPANQRLVDLLVEMREQGFDDSDIKDVMRELSIDQCRAYRIRKIVRTMLGDASYKKLQDTRDALKNRNLALAPRVKMWLNFYKAICEPRPVRAVCRKLGIKQQLVWNIEKKACHRSVRAAQPTADERIEMQDILNAWLTAQKSRLKRLDSVYGLDIGSWQ